MWDYENFSCDSNDTSLSVEVQLAQFLNTNKIRDFKVVGFTSSRGLDILSIVYYKEAQNEQ